VGKVGLRGIKETCLHPIPCGFKELEAKLSLLLVLCHVNHALHSAEMLPRKLQGIKHN
jgi:hypothetical protein